MWWRLRIFEKLVLSLVSKGPSFRLVYQLIVTTRWQQKSAHGSNVGKFYIASLGGVAICPLTALCPSIGDGYGCEDGWGGWGVEEHPHRSGEERGWDGGLQRLNWEGG